jgi:hypothetical protein
VIEIIIIVLAVLVVVALVWARIGAARSESRSVETYEHALDVLGEVSKRTETRNFRILPHEQAGRAHVRRPLEDGGDAAPEPGRPAAPPSALGSGPLASKRLPPAGQPKLRFSDPMLETGRQPAVGPRSGERDREEPGNGSPSGTTAAGPLESAASALAGERSSSSGGRAPARPASVLRRGATQASYDRRRQVLTRRIATGGAGAVAIAAVAVATVLLTGGGGHGHKVTPTTIHHARGATSTTTTSTTTTTTPTTLTPTSVTATDVSFTAPSGDYTLSFQATTGACWVGIQPSGGGTWLFAETLDAGQSATYKGSGALVVRLGAPTYIDLDVNGLAAKLPSALTQPYNVDLTPSTS